MQPRLPGSSPATSETMIAIILNLCSPLLVRLEMVMVTVQLGCCETRRLERYVWLTWLVWCASRSLSPHLQPEVQLAFGRGMEAGWSSQDQGQGCRGYGCWAHRLRRCWIYSHSHLATPMPMCSYDLRNPSCTSTGGPSPFACCSRLRERSRFVLMLNDTKSPEEEEGG